MCLKKNNNIYYGCILKEWIISKKKLYEGINSQIPSHLFTDTLYTLPSSPENNKFRKIDNSPEFIIQVLHLAASLTGNWYILIEGSDLLLSPQL